MILIRMVLPLILQLAGLAFVVTIDPYVQRKDKNKLLLVVLIAASFILQNILEGTLSQHVLLIANTAYYLSIRPVITVLFMYVLCPKLKKTFVWIIAGINAAINMTAFFTPLAFGYDENNEFFAGPLVLSCFVLNTLLLTILVVRTIREKKLFRPVEFIPPLVIAVLLVASSVADFLMKDDKGVLFLTITMVSACLFVIILLHMALARENERMMQAEQRIRIMMSQIQPHFLFNTLSTIQALCLSDPEKAFSTVEKFGTYLRNNIDSLDQENMIPISKELEHTRTYAQIEMIRFPSIEIEYDIQDEDFLVPALTVQPLIENAIRHGIRGMVDGHVTVSTRRDKNDHVIIVADNGKGFDPRSMMEGDNSHIGLPNVMERIETLCRGSVDVKSTGEGTAVTVRIPAVKEKL